MQADSLIEKIQELGPAELIEVEDFVDFIRMRDEQRKLAREASASSTASFAAVWSNPEDDVYDGL